MGKILNFDKFISEKKQETITVTIMGEEYSVPMEIPAIVPVMMARAESMDGQQQTRMVMLAADAMLGAENVDKLCNKGFSAANLAALVQQLFKEINEGSSDEDEDSEEVTDEDSRIQTGEGKLAKK